MPFQRVMLGQLRMVEISLHIVGHADPVHHMTRTKIAYRSKRDNFLKTQFVKTEGEGGTRSLLSVSPTPVIERKPPTNFHTRRKRKRISEDAQPNKPNEDLCPFYFGSPQSEPVSANPFFSGCDHGLGLSAAQ